jgi:Fe2+ transport system protein FeoA
MAKPKIHLLTDMPVGQRVLIEAVSSAPAQHRLRALGIEYAEEMLLVHRGDYGDLIVAVGERHVHLPEHVARRMRVRTAPSPPGPAPSYAARPDAA